MRPSSPDFLKLWVNLNLNPNPNSLRGPDRQPSIKVHLWRYLEQSQETSAGIVNRVVFNWRTVGTDAHTARRPVSLLMWSVPCLFMLSSHGPRGSSHIPLHPRKPFLYTSTLRGYLPSHSSSSLLQSHCLWIVQPSEIQPRAKWSVDTLPIPSGSLEVMAHPLM